MSILLVSITEVKLLLGGNANFPDDDLLTMLVQQVSARCETYLNRDLEDTGTSATEYFNGNGVRRVFPLRRYPVSSVTTVHDSLDRSYGTGDLISSDDYAVHLLEGYVEMEYPPQQGMRNVRIVYDGGYEADAETGVLPVPDGMKQAALLQSAEVYRRRESMSMTGVSSDAGTIGMVQDVFDLTPGVKRLLDPYKAFALGGP